MAWVVDTCLLIDIAEADPMFGRCSADLLYSLRDQGLTVCPVSYVELAPVFEGSRTAQDGFLRNIYATSLGQWLLEDTICAHPGVESKCYRKAAAGHFKTAHRRHTDRSFCQ